MLLNLSPIEINEFPQGGEGIGSSFLDAINKCKSADELIMAVKSKRYTYTRISRLLMQITFLGIKRTGV